MGLKGQGSKQAGPGVRVKYITILALRFGVAYLVSHNLHLPF